MIVSSVSVTGGDPYRLDLSRLTAAGWKRGQQPNRWSANVCPALRAVEV